MGVADDQTERVRNMIDHLEMITPDGETIGDLTDWWFVLDCLAMCRFALTPPAGKQPTPETKEWFADMAANADMGDVTAERLGDALTLADLRIVPSNDMEAGQAYIQAVGRAVVARDT